MNIYHEMFQGEWQADTGRGIPKAKLVNELSVRQAVNPDNTCDKPFD